MKIYYVVTHRPENARGTPRARETDCRPLTPHLAGPWRSRRPQEGRVTRETKRRRSASAAARISIEMSISFVFICSFQACRWPLLPDSYACSKQMNMLEILGCRSIFLSEGSEAGGRSPNNLLHTWGITEEVHNEGSLAPRSSHADRTTDSWTLLALCSTAPS